MSEFWCESAWVDGQPVAGVSISARPDGIIESVRAHTRPLSGASILRGLTLPGLANVHSHAFHRLLRGAETSGGDFWSWRDGMYQAAAALTPEGYYDLAHATYSEMLLAGWTAVGEFHYLHHQPDGTPYPDHEMERALAAAAADVGIRLTLLDTCYLSSGFGAPLTPAQARFGDGDGTRWARRFSALAEALPATTTFRLGAAIHSVRAVPEADITHILAAIGDETPLHIHVSEQPQENADCLTNYGGTPVEILARAGALGRRTTAIHATHLTPSDLTVLAATDTIIGLCPTTEADLGDGIGPAAALAGAGCRLAVGSDQNVVIDPFAEIQAVEAGQRLASGRRGIFSAADLVDALARVGYASLGIPGGELRAGLPCDLVAVETDALETVGSAPDRVPMTARSTNVHSVVVGGRLRALDRREVSARYARAFTRVAQFGRPQTSTFPAAGPVSGAPGWAATASTPADPDRGGAA